MATKQSITRRTCWATARTTPIDRIGPRLTGRRAIILGALMAAVMCASTGRAQAHEQEHGIALLKGCSGPVCVGEYLDCTMRAQFVSDYPDAYEITHMWDIVQSDNGDVRVPDTGDLPIIRVFGNALCTDQDGTCDAQTGEDCALPCYIGPPGAFLETPIGDLPGLPDAGYVRFRQDEYMVQPGDVDETPEGMLMDLGSMEWKDLCNSEAEDCLTNEQVAEQKATTLVITLCEDGDPCTDNECIDGQCVYPCNTDPCDDGDDCTENDTCSECGCVGTPFCTEDGQCDDGDVCTDDACVDGCCVHTCNTDPCDDGDDCTENDTCSECQCVGTPICIEDADCDDGDVCTDDECVDGCCVYPCNTEPCDDDDPCTTADTCSNCECVGGPPPNCDDGEECTDDSCDPKIGCVNDRQCEVDSDCEDDGDSCTTNVCNEDGCCVPAPLRCRMTGGGHSPNEENANRYTWGGQVGSPTADQPQPCGEWTHRQHRGPDDLRFTFHAGTASAPDGTEIDSVQCCDAGWCDPALPAPAKQIDFAGIGTFKNISDPNGVLGDVEPGESLHWFEVHAEDLGEPGSHDMPPNGEKICPAQGHAGDSASCDCPDFYRITIFKRFNPDKKEKPNKTEVIYSEFTYLAGGNHQIHPPLEGKHNCHGGGR